MNHTLRRILTLVFGAVFLFSLLMILRIVLQGYQEQSAFEELAALTDGQTQTDTADPNALESEESPYAELKARNQDFFGWIAIEDTKIDYPVMYTPDDPEHYLRRAFDGSYAESGVPFLSADCFEGCGNWLVYGHNMKNGTMFAALLSYAKEDFWRDHPVIEFDTLQDEGSYEVMAAFYSKIYAEGESGLHYYEYTDLRDPAVYAEYVDGITQAALYDTGVLAECGDQLLTLSTCSYHTDNGRFVVVARKLPG